MSNFVSLANLVKERRERKSQKKKEGKEINQAGIFFLFDTQNVRVKLATLWTLMGKLFL